VQDFPVEASEVENGPPSRFLRIKLPANIDQAVKYCKALVDHFKTCNGTSCKHMAKTGPLWVLKKLGHGVDSTTTWQDIHHILATSTNLFRSTWSSSIYPVNKSFPDSYASEGKYLFHSSLNWLFSLLKLFLLFLLILLPASPSSINCGNGTPNILAWHQFHIFKFT